ncbi:Putative uncharacterized protein [Moritella viscosa]|uniref:hypothetical protein n=1 Tax=Moritella viscosa TaxID=80854 RepID=UPI0005090A4C|nr:hypothetical protein [Moritella viscosa]CED58348.1 putative uncharacterized protein [Moritella viscosa]SHN95916.1 Putative uncharacterized protein [Moritella viscosa]SHO19268.1 Putative uncharacterized protein [Moritella viscosa]
MAMKVRTTNQTGANETHLNKLITRLHPIIRSILLKYGDDLSSAICEGVGKAGFCMFALYRGKPYFVFEGEAINKMVPIDSPEFNGFIGKLIKLALGKAPSPRLMKPALENLKNEIILDGVVVEAAEFNSYLNAAFPNEGVILDSNDQNGGSLLLRDGVVTSPETATGLTFIHKPAKGKLTYIPSGGDNLKLEKLHDLFSNLNRNQFYLILAYITFILAHPRSQGLTYPMLYVYGSAGTGKTTVVKLITKLLGLGQDTVKTLPKSERDLVAIAANHYILCFDNVANISNELSNAFCNVVTGATVTARTLHTNTDTTDIEYHQPMIMTAITLPRQYDLTTRAAFIHTSKPTKSYKNENEIFQLLDAMLPEVQSWLLDTAAKTMKNVVDVESIIDHRAASYIQWVAGFEKTMGIEDQSIQKCFMKETEEGLNQQTAEHNPFITSIAGAVEEFGEFTGTPTEVHKALGSYIQSLEMRLPIGWPANANAMSIKLNNSVELLAKQGVEWFVDAKRGTKGRNATLRPILLPEKKETLPLLDDQELKQPTLPDVSELELVPDDALDWTESALEDMVLEDDTSLASRKKTEEENHAELLAFLG